MKVKEGINGERKKKQKNNVFKKLWGMRATGKKRLKGEVQITHEPNQTEALERGRRKNSEERRECSTRKGQIMCLR